MKLHLLTAAVAAVIAAPVAAAGTPAPAVATSMLGVSETMIVTATRFATPESKVLAPVSVIAAEDIARLQMTDINQLLSRLAGMESQSAGGLGSNTGLFVRGGNTLHTLVLVDGVRVNSSTLGQTALEHIDLSNIERVELVRGPASSLYGADAVSGVLNIITKRPGAAATTFKTEIGSHNLQRSSLSTGNSYGNTSWSLVLGQESLTGFDRTVGDSFYNGDDDAYRSTHVAANLQQQWTERAVSNLGYQINKGQIEQDNECLDGFWSEVACAPYADFRQEVLNLDNSWKVTDKVELKALVARAVDSTRNGDDLVTPLQVEGSDNRFKTTKDTYQLQSQFRLSEQLQLATGAEYYNDRLNAGNNYLATSRDNMAWFGNAVVSLGANEFTAGLRNDDNESFGTHNTQSLSWGYRLTEQWKVIASWGTAFRAPTFNDLYWPEDPYGVGNPELAPEESENTDLGVKYQSSLQRLSATVFRNKVDNLINWAPVDANDPWGQWTPSNIDNARMRGFELEYGLSWGNWDSAATYTWLDADDLGTDDRLVNRSRRIFNVDVDYTLGKFGYGLTVKARSARFADVANTRELAGYGVVDARISYQATKDLLLTGSLTNLLDKDYTARENFNEQGRGFVVGFSYSL